MNKAYQGIQIIVVQFAFPINTTSYMLLLYVLLKGYLSLNTFFVIWILSL
jgi:hypothetical protein